MTKQNHKANHITFRVTDKDKQVIIALKEHYTKQGKKFNVSKIVRNVLLNHPLD